MSSRPVEASVPPGSYLTQWVADAGGVKTSQESEYPFIWKSDKTIKTWNVASWKLWKANNCFLTFHNVPSRNGDITSVNRRIKNYDSLYLKDTDGRLHSFVCISSSLSSTPEDLNSHSWVLDPNIKICYETTCDQCLATERMNDGSWQVSQATQNSNEITKMMSSLIKIYCLHSPWLLIVPQAFLSEQGN